MIRSCGSLLRTRFKRAQTGLPKDEAWKVQGVVVPINSRAAPCYKSPEAVVPGRAVRGVSDQDGTGFLHLQ